MLKSKTGIYSFHLYTESNRVKNHREGETKLSANIKFGTKIKSCTYVILGISEDIGPQMNGGFGGSNLGFMSCCQALQNVQSNAFYSGDNLGILGEIVQNKDFVSVKECNGWVEELDDFVQEVLSLHLIDRQKLIVIGGGHNNAFPIIAQVSQQSNKPIHAINIDPHTDCRTTEYRHSGNPFSFAFENKFLLDYTVFGLHQSYNNQYILEFLSKNKFHFTTFEDWLDNPSQYWSDWLAFCDKLSKDRIYTLDIDLDAIAFCPSSALSPSGFSIEEIRKMIRHLCMKVEFTALHLPEGGPKTETEERLYGKMVSYFILDFIKVQDEKYPRNTPTVQ